MAPPAEGLLIRPVEEGELEALLALYARAFGRSMSAARWRWKLRPHLPGVDNVLVALEGERIVFQYAGVPWTWETPVGRRPAIASVDTMADPERRRRGLLTAVGGHTYARWSEAGLAFVIGIPNERWGSRAHALGWRPRLGLTCWMRPLRFFGRALAPVPTGRRVTEVKVAPEALDGLWARVRGGFDLALVRDARWVQWRFLDAPELGYRVLLAERQGRLAGYAALRVDGEHGYLAELIAARGDHATAVALIDAAAALARALGAHKLLVLLPEESWMRPAFFARGFVFARGRFVVQTVSLRSDLLPEAALSGRWLITGADFDLH